MAELFRGSDRSYIAKTEVGSRTARRCGRGGASARLRGQLDSQVEASGRRVRYLNIGDPIQFGFKTPPHLIDAIAKAMRDGHNGYTASVGIEPARKAVAAEYTRRGMPVSPIASC